MALAESSGIPAAIEESKAKRADAIKAHLDYVTEHSYDQLGTAITPMWLATIDIRSNGLPEPNMPERLRRELNATSPSGANLYWDQPTIVAAYELSKRTGCKCYSDAADAYIQSYLEACFDPRSGLLWWGGHHYYDVQQDAIVGPNDDRPTTLPYTPAWETMWRVDSKIAERQIRLMADLYDTDASMCLGSDAVLIDSLIWLASQESSDCQSLTAAATELALDRFDSRNLKTNLIASKQSIKQETDVASIGEIGVWAGSLLRAADKTNDKTLRFIAAKAVRSCLIKGYDPAAKKYYRRISIENGLPATTGSLKRNSPTPHLELFGLHLLPNHHHAMPMAETCLSLFARTNDAVFREAVTRWVNQIKRSLPANDGKGAYAEDYGRVIHFLTRAAELMDEPSYRRLAEQVANDAMRHLYEPMLGMFRSHPGENRCDSVDGPGYLLLALLYLDGDDPTERSTLQF